MQTSLDYLERCERLIRVIFTHERSQLIAPLRLNFTSRAQLTPEVAFASSGSARRTIMHIWVVICIPGGLSRLTPPKGLSIEGI